jgi:hypothetical protein
MGPGTQGHSKNPSGDGVNSIGAVFAEVFSGFAYRQAKASDDGEGCIAHAGQRTGAASYTATILVH